MGSSHSNLPEKKVAYVESDWEFVMEATMALEHLLATRFGALGPDLPTMVISVQPRLPAHALPALRYVITARMNMLCSKPQPRLTPYQKSKLIKVPPVDRKMFLVHFEYALRAVQGASSPVLTQSKARKSLAV